MPSMFARIYIALLLGLLVIGGTLFWAVDGVNRWRYQTHLDAWAAVPASLIRDGLERQPAARQEEWLGFMASLTGVGWQLQDTEISSLRYSDLHWSTQQATIELPLSDGRSLTADIRDWTELRIGLGYLLLNELSRAPADERGQRLAQLSESLPFAVTAGELDPLEIGFLGERQLVQGQAFVQREVQPLGVDREIIYLPMGENNVLRLGPVDTFAWVTPLGLAIGTLITLLALGTLVLLILRPLNRRLQRITRAVDGITDDPDSVAVPETPNDELGVMGRRVNAMAERLLTLVRRNQELNQAVSHDLKTPLARIRFALELMAPGPKQAEEAEVVYQAVDELEGLINELLQYHRLMASDGEGTGWQEVTLSRVLARLSTPAAPSSPTTPSAPSKTSRPAAPSAVSGSSTRSALNLPAVSVNESLTMTVEQEGPDTLWLPMEAQTLTRLLTNLLDNAARHARSAVALKLNSTARQLCITVDDDGPGIPPSDRERVFEPFVRLDAARNLKSQGHGLGLSICQAMVAAVDGNIRVLDNSEGGARIEITIPNRKHPPTFPQQKSET